MRGRGLLVASPLRSDWCSRPSDSDSSLSVPSFGSLQLPDETIEIVKSRASLGSGDWGRDGIRNSRRWGQRSLP